jgi:arylsulfatase A-like enzyme
MTRRTFLAATSAAAFSKRTNALLITVDDLRPQLGCYGDKQVKSPNIDRLAARGLVFERAYCQMALCSPSRTSLLTGLRPDTTRVFDLTTHFRQTVPDAVTLPELFKNNGYYAHGIYKVFHLAGTAPRVGNMNDPQSWSDDLELPGKPVYGPRGQALLEADMEAYKRDRAAGIIRPIRSLATEAPEIADDDLSDGETATRAIAALRRVAGRPFFLALGFYKPHLPFVAPRKYWDLYEARDLKAAANSRPPEGAPPFALQGTAELRNFTDVPREGPIDEALGLRLLHGYLASISYVDAQIGRVLRELDRQRLWDRTVVVLLGDNGYQMGEHGMWASKHTNFETSARVPLIVAAPGERRGVRTAALTELVDVYPTLSDLCGLQPPARLEGVSARPLFHEPDREWKRAAFTQYPKSGRMGRSVRTSRYRYTEWTRAGAPSAEAVELYDHETDPGENVNVADAAERKAAVAECAALLRAGWKGAAAQ